MKKLVLAFAAAATLGLGIAGSTTSAEAKWGGGKWGGGGFHHGHGFKGHWGGHGHWGHGYRHWGHRWGGVRIVSYGGGGYGSCWRYRWTPYGYRYVNVCVRPLYY